MVKLQILRVAEVGQKPLQAKTQVRQAGRTTATLSHGVFLYFSLCLSWHCAQAQVWQITQVCGSILNFGLNPVFDVDSTPARAAVSLYTKVFTELTTDAPKRVFWNSSLGR
jgi:hypothetical protein